MGVSVLEEKPKPWGVVGCQKSTGYLTSTFAVESWVDSVARPSVGLVDLEIRVPWSFVYFTVGRIVELILLCLRRRESNEVEILVLRHELDILRRQQQRPRSIRRTAPGSHC